MDELPSQKEIDSRNREAKQAFLDRLKPGSWDELKPLALSGMPIFTFEKEGAVAVAGRALTGLAILILLNALLFWGAAASFMKSEVK
jgi:hypothetical protein